MGYNALFVLYCAITLRCHKHTNIVSETRLGFPKAVVTSTVTVIFTVKLTLALCHIPLTYPKMALANNKT